MSSTNNPRSQGRLHTEGIFRRALGDSDTDMQAIPQFDPELDSKFDSYAPHRDPHFGTDSPEPNAQGRVDDLYRRTEPTLDLPSAVSGWREPEHTLPPVPPPLDDDDLPPAGRREPWRVLRWALASAATVTVSAVIGLALLTLPDAAQPEAKPSGMTSWLPSWVRDAVVAMAGKPVSTPASTSESVTESAPGSSSKTVAASSPESPAALQPAGSAASQQAAAVPEPDVQSGGTATSDAAQTTAASTVPDTAAASAAEPPSAAPAPVAAAPSTATREASVDDGRVAAASQTSPPPVERATAPAKVAERKSVKTISKQPGAIAEKSGTRERTAAQRPARSEERLVRAAPPGSIFVQHVSLASKADAQAWRARHRGLARTRIIAVNTSGKEIKYAVVSGPFASRKEAEAFAARDGVATAPWFRPQASLRAALPAERH